MLMKLKALVHNVYTQICIPMFLYPLYTRGFSEQLQLMSTFNQRFHILKEYLKSIAAKKPSTKKEQNIHRQ